MKLERAIEIGQEDLERMNPDIDPDERHALNLLIEAGKRLQLGRKGIQRFSHTLLPGETEE